MAFTKGATGTIAHDTQGYHDWYGTPAPSITPGSPTCHRLVHGGVQAAWSVTGNADYVVSAGSSRR